MSICKHSEFTFTALFASVPHVLVIESTTGKVTDYSMDPELSLPVTYDVTFPIHSYWTGPYYWLDNLTLTFMYGKKGTFVPDREYHVWQLGDSMESATSFTDLPVDGLPLFGRSVHATCKTTVFILGVGSEFIYKSKC